MSFLDRLAHGWNAFKNKDPSEYPGFNYYDGGTISYARPDRTIMTRGNEKSIVTALYNRIAVDVAAMNVKHIKLDDNERYIEDCDSSLNYCLTVEANKDQTARAFIQDAVLSLFDEGCIALVPIDTNKDPRLSMSFEIESLRVGRIVEWKPDMVKIRAYNDLTGNHEERYFLKRSVAIIENPFYVVMNEQNSVAKRLVSKLNLLDVIDNKTGSDKLNMILQMPFVIKTPARKQQAERRIKEIETQMTTSSLGIAYTDGTEKIIQLNRSLENNIMTQVEYYTNLLFSQLGIDMSILNGTADEQTLLNYQNNVLEPVIAAICTEMHRKFLTKTARTQKQAIKFFFDPFKIIPTSQISEIADKFTRNEIMTSNEIRQLIGLKPSSDPNADQLRNKNLNQSAGAMAEEQTGDMSIGDPNAAPAMGGMITDPDQLIAQYEAKMKELDDNEAKLTEMENMLKK